MNKLTFLLKKPLYRTSMLLLISSMLNAFLSFLFWLVAARVFASSDVGLVAAMTSAAGLIASVACLGFNAGLLRFLPEAVDRKSMVNSVFVLSFLASVLVSVLFVIGTPVWSRDLVFVRNDWHFFWTFLPVAAGTALSYSMTNAFVALRRPGLALVHAMSSAAIRIPVVIGLARFGLFGLWSSWLVFLAFNSILFIALFRQAEAGYLPWPQLNLRMIKTMGRYSLGCLGAEVPYMAATSIIPLMVLAALGPESTAHYYIAFRVGSAALTVANYAGMSLLVEGAYDSTHLRDNLMRVARFSAVLLTPVLLIIFLAGRHILRLFGNEYSSEALTTTLLITVASVPHIITELYITVKRVQLRVFSFMVMPWIVMTLTLVVTWLALPSLGLSGAGLGWVGGYTLVSVIIGITALVHRLNR